MQVADTTKRFKMVAGGVIWDKLGEKKEYGRRFLSKVPPKKKKA